MSRHYEKIDKGLVTNKDPALLMEGELQFIQNAVYKPSSQALQRARGRAVFGTVSATARDVMGLRDAQFDNGDHFLIALAGSAYSTALVGDTGTFGVLSASVVSSASIATASASLDRVHYRNRFYLLNGDLAPPYANIVNSNRVAYLSATGAGQTLNIRQHGMLPVQGMGAVATASGTFSLTVTGYYEYWVTEVAKVSQDGVEQVIEGTFEGLPQTHYISATGQVPVISRPGIRNPGSTHWRVYRSTKKEREKDVAFPVGFLIAEAPISTSAQRDSPSGTTTTSFAFPASAEGTSPWNTLAGKWKDGAARTSAFADDGNVMTLTVPAGTRNHVGQSYAGFNLGAFSGSITDIQVEVEAWVSSGTAPLPLKVEIGRVRIADGYIRDSASQTHQVSATAAGAGAVVTFGGLWRPSSLPPFTSTDFENSATDQFCVSLQLPLFGGATAATDRTLSIDYAKMRVSYAGSVESVVPFPTVVYTFGDTTVQVGKNGVPPSSSTGDLFEDTLVVNDVSNPSLVRWSAPGDPDAFPSTYYLDLETSDNDRVTCIKVVNDVLVIGCHAGFGRANYLPSERDSSFDRGKAFKWVSRSYGIVHPMCACAYSPPQGGERLAAISKQGIFSTDGYDFKPMTSLKWSDIISRASTSYSIALINDPENEELIFYYRNDDDAPESYKALHLSYSSDHRLESGEFKVSGPVHMRNYDGGTGARADLRSAWAVPRDNDDTDILLGYGGASASAVAGVGKVYRETGSFIPAEDDAMKYRTRRLFLAGLGNEWSLEGLYGYISNQGADERVTYSTTNYRTNKATSDTGSSETFVLANGVKLHRVGFHQAAEGLEINFAGDAGGGDLAHEGLVIDGKDFGEEKSGL